ncbi:unnamed protein product [Didymodactylos carnosus]|uniref:Retrotransposon gag domain-containing protein n=1 Tax=Didymodactylos carnosus TaxID=1234261 RepID=A0A815R121_9BILA|nr:unnamed protein product [Didymodactylos carnosus]CAF4338505.1 unnamed protein product [Didymodactylos carnosus]
MVGDDQLYYASTLLRDAALQWYHNERKEIDDCIKQPILSFLEFKQRIRLAFEPPHHQQPLRRQLRILKQTTTAQQYIYMNFISSRSGRDMRDIIAVAPRIMRDSGPGMPNYVNMEDMKTGLGIGCTFAIILMIFSCVCFGIELHAYITYVPPPKRATPPPASPPPASPPPASPPPASPPPASPPARRVSPAIVLPPPSYDDAMRVPDYIPRRPAPPARSRSFVGPYGDPHRSYMGDRPSYERRDGPGLTRVETEPYVTVKTTGVHITNPRSTTRHTLLVAPSTCPRSICKEFLESLGLSPQYFTRSHDECYCTRCYPPSRTKIKSKGGYEYTVPVGWVRFSLHIDSALSKSKKIFQRWATSYYGTSADKLEPILRYGNGSIPFPNDQMPSGETFGTHLKDKDHLYTSQGGNTVLRIPPLRGVNFHSGSLRSEPE